MEEVSWFRGCFLQHPKTIQKCPNTFGGHCASDYGSKEAFVLTLKNYCSSSISLASIRCTTCVLCLSCLANSPWQCLGCRQQAHLMDSVGFSACAFLSPAPDHWQDLTPSWSVAHQCCECHGSLFQTGVVHLSVKDCQKNSTTMTGHCFSLRLYRLDSDVPRAGLSVMEMWFCCGTYRELTGDIRSMESFGVVFNDSRGAEMDCSKWAQEVTGS